MSEPTYAEREKARKADYEIKRWRKNLVSKHSGGAVTDMELPIAAIDQSPAAAVRAGLNQDAVDRYGEADDLPPVEVYAGGGKNYLSDGRHRIATALAGGAKKILCRVHKCEDADAALTLARLAAFGANSSHGLPRSPDDKRACIKACLALPEYADKSDRHVAELCKVSKWLVGQVRAELAGAAKPAPRTVPAATKAAPAPTQPEPRPATATTGRATTNAEPARPPGPEEQSESPAPAATRKNASDGRVYDARGRAVPEPLAPLFKLGRAFAADLRAVAGELLDGVKTASGEAWGAGLSPLLPNIDGDLKKVTQDAASALPHCCCPHIDQGTGEHLLPGNCKVCVKNRGWLSRQNWHQLSDPVKKLIDEHAETTPEADAA